LTYSRHNKLKRKDKKTHITISNGDNATPSRKAPLVLRLIRISRPNISTPSKMFTRFILNLPESELQTMIASSFQLEQAWWFCELDLIQIRTPSSLLQHTETFLRKALSIQSSSPPSFPNSRHVEPNSAYKRKIINYGCILLSQTRRSHSLQNLEQQNLHLSRRSIRAKTAPYRSGNPTKKQALIPACDFGLTNEIRRCSPGCQSRQYYLAISSTRRPRL
jgi:hypothetical protein